MSQPDSPDQLRQLATVALQAYDLPVTSITFVRSLNNAVYKVVAGKQAYALRLHRPGFRSMAETQAELQFLQQLHAATGLAVPEPVPTRNGDLVACVAIAESGLMRHADMLTWLEGRTYRPGKGLGPRRVFQLGATLGCIHHFARQFTPSADFTLPGWDADGLFTSASPFNPGVLEDIFAPEERPLFDEVAGRVRTLFAQLGQGRDQWGMIHGDFIFGNCQFRGRTAQVLDFDDCGYGYFLYDLGPLLGNLKDYEDEYGNRAAQLRTAFLAGYASQHTLPSATPAQLDLMVAARHAHACLQLAGFVRAGAPIDHVAEIHAYRINELRAYLATVP